MKSSFLEGFSVRVSEEHVDVRGVSFGYGNGGRLNILCRFGHFYVLYHPSLQDFGGVGSAPETVPATYYLVRIVNGQVTKVYQQEEPGRQWYKTRVQLRHVCLNLARGAGEEKK